MLYIILVCSFYMSFFQVIYNHVNRVAIEFIHLHILIDHHYYLIVLQVDKMYLLVTHLTGNALKLRDRLDRDIVAACMEVLKALFPEEVSSTDSFHDTVNQLKFAATLFRNLLR